MAGAADARRAAGSPSPHRLLTVCPGALLAVDTGLLAGRRRTTHHALLADLARTAPAAQVLANRVWVEDGALLSSAGITAAITTGITTGTTTGIDLALHGIPAVGGDALAASVAQVMVAGSGRAGNGAARRNGWRCRPVQQPHPRADTGRGRPCQHPTAAQGGGGRFSANPPPAHQQPTAGQPPAGKHGVAGWHAGCVQSLGKLTKWSASW